MIKFLSTVFTMLAVIGVVFLAFCLFAGLDTESSVPGSQDSLPDYIDFWVVFAVASVTVCFATIALHLSEK